MSTSRDSAGIVIRETRVPEWHAAAAWTLAEEPELAVGRQEGGSTDVLHGVVDAHLLDNGHLIVANAGTAEIRVYDGTGRYVRSVGGRGEGPGEFRDLRSLVNLGDSIVAFDPALQRLSLFGSAGTFDRSVAIESPDVGSLIQYHAVGAIGKGVLLVANRFSPESRSPATVYIDSVPNLLVSGAGTVTGGVGGMAEFELYGTPERGWFRPFGRMTVADAQGSFIVMGAASSYEIRLYDESGLLGQIWRRSYEPTAVTQEAVEQLVSDRLELYGIAPSDARAAGIRESLEVVPLPDVMPAFSQIVASPSGHVWVQDYAPLEARGPRQWTVFGADGAWLGSVEVPGRHLLFQIDEERVVGVWRDDLGVESVRVYRIVKPSGAARSSEPPASAR